MIKTLLPMTFEITKASLLPIVIPAKAGIYPFRSLVRWTPAYAGVTEPM
jgi:hypothetical protein